MRTALWDDETLLKSGRANLLRGIESVGGTLYLSSRRLVFESHDCVVQTGLTEIALRDVRDVEPCWTRLFGVVPIMPNALCVSTRHGVDFSFTLYGRREWMAAVVEAIRALGPGSAA